jgi:predicted dehydrogenase
MGRRHIQVLRKMGLEVSGVFDISRESLELARVEEAVPESALFDRLETLLDTARPECVIIATTADSHCALTCAAAESGAKYVLLEKPMAVSLDECDRIIDTCARTGTGLAINHQMRFMDQYREPKRLVDTDEYGGLASMTVVGGNFGMAMLGTHIFEAFRFMTGERPSEVSAWFSPEVVANPRGPQFQDRAGSIRAVTPGGRRLYIEAGADQGHGMRVVYGCRYGMITVDGLNGDIMTTARQPEHRSLPTTRYGMPSASAHWKIPPAEVIDSTVAVLTALFTGENNVSGEHGRQAVEALVAAYQSAGQGGVGVQLEAGLDRRRVFPWA